MAGNVTFADREVGEVRLISVPDPALQTDWLYVIPAGELWRILQVKQRTVFSAGGYIHDCIVQFTDSGGVVWCRVGNSPAARIGNANTLVCHSINNGNTNRVLTGCYSANLPDVFLPGGFSVGTAWQNLAAADYVYQIRILAQVWRLS